MEQNNGVKVMPVNSGEIIFEHTYLFRKEDRRLNVSYINDTQTSNVWQVVNQSKMTLL